MTNQKLAGRFLVGGQYGKASNMSIRHSVLYTYEQPLAYMKDGRVIINADRYSATSNRHRILIEWEAIRIKIPVVLVSLDSLSRARISRPQNALDITVVDFAQATHIIKYSFEEGYDDMEKHYQGGEWHYYTTPKGDRVKDYHKAGGVLIKDSTTANHWLAGFDENQYFISRLPVPCKTIVEAYEALKPEIVKQAIAEGKKVLRQGEWFFIPVSISLKKKNFKANPLPTTIPNSNYHVCRHMIVDTHIYCASNTTVYHRDQRGRGTRQHRALKLGNSIYTAVMNTALESYSIEGRVD